MNRLKLESQIRAAFSKPRFKDIEISVKDGVFSIWDGRVVRSLDIPIFNLNVIWKAGKYWRKIEYRIDTEVKNQDIIGIIEEIKRKRKDKVPESMI